MLFRSVTFVVKSVADPPSAIVAPETVILLFANSPLLISPAPSVTLFPERSRVDANSAATIPPFLIVTTPLATAKLSELNDATPLALVVWYHPFFS